MYIPHTYMYIPSDGPERKKERPKERKTERKTERKGKKKERKNEKEGKKRKKYILAKKEALTFVSKPHGMSLVPG